MSAVKKTTPHRFTLVEIDNFNACVRKAAERQAVLAHVLIRLDDEEPLEPGTDLHNGLIELAIATADDLAELKTIAANAWKGKAGL